MILRNEKHSENMSLSEYQPALICSLYHFNLAVTSQRAAYFTGQMLDVPSSSSVYVGLCQI